MKVVGIIPARYNSTRLPGKPLIDINGKPMIWWVYHRVCKVNKIDEIYAATDDMRIYQKCEEFKIPVIMTSTKHRTAANRLWEVSNSVSADFYLQLNGDEPLINTLAIEKAIIDNIPQNIEFGTNIITKVTDPVLVMDSSNIKVVFDQNMNALYMSRCPIPFPFKSLEYNYYKHVGIIGYNKKMLDFYNQSVPGKLELIEGIDTLRFLDYGKTLRFVIVDNCESLSVDTQMDLEYIRKVIKEKNHGERH